MRDLYLILGVERTATPEEIKKAYRKLAMKFHPDRTDNDPKKSERFKEVTAAFDVLGDTEKRKLYDEFGELATRPGFDPEQARQYAQAREATRGGFNWSQAQGSGVHSTDDFLKFIFGDLFGGGRGGGGFDPGGPGFGAGGPGFGSGGPGFGPGFGAAGPAGAAPRDLQQELALNFLQAVRGDQVEIRLRYQDRCPACGGRGGRRNSGACTACGGQGTQIIDRTLKVRIPPGAEDGRKLRIRHQGAAAGPGGTPGDLVLTIRVAPHPYYTRRDRDIHVTVPITLEKAFSGARLKLETPLGKSIRLTVPPGSGQGAQLRVPGHGVQSSGCDPAGDFIITLKIQLPARITPERMEAARLLSEDVTLELPGQMQYVD
jgi:DnaJ-class molecular chaperone